MPHSHWWRWLVFGAVAACGMSAAVSARGVGDWVDVTLRDGREFFGQVVEETDFKVVLNVKQGAITAKMTLVRSDIRQITTQHSALESAIPESPGGSPGPAKNNDETLAAAAPGTGGYIIAPLEGVFGEDLTAGIVRAVLQRGVDAKAEAVVFVLNSPGGMVSELAKVREAIDSYAGRIRGVLYVQGEAFSAAALLCMSNQDFYVGPAARLGAAVAYQEKSSGSKEVDAKYNSAFAARWRALTEKVGRPSVLVDAMVVMEREVYADTRATPWALTSRKPAKDPEAFEEIDGPTTILSLTGSQAVACRAADGAATDALDVVRQLKLKNTTRRAIDGESFVRVYRKTYERNMEVIRRAVEDYNDTSDILADQKNIRKFEQRLREMRSSLQRIIVLFKKYDYVENYFLARGQSIEDLDRMLRRINEALKEL